MAASSQGRDRERLCIVPSLSARRQHERQPMGWDRRVKKRDRESRKRDRRENSLVHIRRKCGTTLSALPFRTKVIGLVGFEPTASASRTQRSTKLSHSPN